MNNVFDGGKMRLINTSAMVFAFSTVAALATSVAAQERLTMGATYSSSSLYTYQVGVATYLNETIDEVNINVRELGGAEVSTEALLRGEVDMSIAVTSTDDKALQGEAPFSEPQEQLRSLYFFAPIPLNFVVAADSGIMSLTDLDGESFNPGGRGSSTEVQVDAILETLGIAPDLVRTDGGDALEAFQNRRIAGFVKAGILPDGYIQQAIAARDVKFLGMTDEQLTQLTSTYSYFSRVDVASEGADFSTVQTAVGVTVTSDLSQEMAYKLAAAVFSDEGRAAAAEVYPASTKFDPVKVTLDASVAPLHIGVYQYLLDHDYTIPDRLVPPEAK